MDQTLDLPPLVADLKATLQARASTPTSQFSPVTYGGVVYADKKSADGAKDNDARALRLQIQQADAVRLGGLS